MALESLDQMPRQPAIAPEKLLLPDGSYANKFSLQKLAYGAGLPVPEIINGSQLQEIEVRRYEAYSRDPEEYFKNDWQYQIHCRGFFTTPVDMWAVDALPTFHDYQSSDKARFQHLMQDALTNPSNLFNLKTNFNLQMIPDAHSFLQRSVPDGFYFSILTQGSDLYCTFIDQDRHGRENWIYYYKGRPNDYSSGVYPDILEYINEELLPLAQRADQIFNQTMIGPFEYKHDFLSTHKGTFLIQSRVASPKVSEQTMYEDHEMIAKMKESGIPEIQIEIGEVTEMTKVVPKDVPYILTITNNTHKGRANTHMIDFNNLKGLCLPSGLRGGLLEHNGYTIIAYALYWGIPIAYV
jgi:hypothetical protein